jgi:serine/threonine protein kinase
LIFGTSVRQMATNPQAEVWRLPAPPGLLGQERDSTPAGYIFRKRFLATDTLGDFTYWTRRENLLLHALNSTWPEIRSIQQFLMLRQDANGQSVLETRHAGPDVGGWLQLPVLREGAPLPHCFAEAAHWFALARATLTALQEVHKRGFVHLDIKAENFCIPYLPADYTPDWQRDDLQLDFTRIRLIDVAFSLWESKVSLDEIPLPVNPEADPQQFRYLSQQFRHALREGQKGNLEPTRKLDFRADLYSLGVMLSGLLPRRLEAASGWTAALLQMARNLCQQLEAWDIDWQQHGHRVPPLPHAALIALCETPLQTPELAARLQQGWQLDPAPASSPHYPRTPITPVVLRQTTPQVAPAAPVQADGSTVQTVLSADQGASSATSAPVDPPIAPRRFNWLAAALGAGCMVGASLWYFRPVTTPEAPAGSIVAPVAVSQPVQPEIAVPPPVSSPPPASVVPDATNQPPTAPVAETQPRAETLLQALHNASTDKVREALLRQTFPSGKADDNSALFKQLLHKTEQAWDKAGYANPERQQQLGLLLALHDYQPASTRSAALKTLADTYQRDSHSIENSDWWQKNAAQDAKAKGWIQETRLLARQGVKLAQFNYGLALSSGKGVTRDSAEGGKQLSTALQRVTASSLAGSDAALVQVGLQIGTQLALLGNDRRFARQLLPGLQHLSELDDITATYLSAEIAACRLLPPNLKQASDYMAQLADLPPTQKGAKAWIELANRRLQAYKRQPLSCNFAAGR